MWVGNVAGSLIGPDGETWDRAVLVKYPNKAAFLSMTMLPEYQETAVHRTAALEDSRLIAATETFSG